MQAEMTDSESGMNLADAVLACDQGKGRHIEEEAVFDYTDDATDFGGGFGGIGDGAAGAVEDDIVFVGDVEGAVGVVAEFGG